ncbi:hypothetical protein M378DRAFT_9822 [Amanita muscaria Koide BX008]|uniref:Uncharacterized protein n=1 Tax=Amanita muscaria (strain Koide BX008) TaxID=946122 RepID=A0A0C2WY59_AMAMK|nr:hypothetical protein M378DRAFT_9822 [Amanita muscaria Koide BX008]
MECRRCPRSVAGRLQAKSLGKNWEDTRIDYLLSSPLDRALCTANALSDHNKGRPEVVIHPNLVERSGGRGGVERKVTF